MFEKKKSNKHFSEGKNSYCVTFCEAINELVSSQGVEVLYFLHLFVRKV